MSFSEANFKPAQYFKGKECYVAYHVVNPFTKQWVRKKIKLNHIHKSAERQRYASMLVYNLNEKLYGGWNPFLDEIGGSGCPSLRDAVESFVAIKSKTIRPDSKRCYRSYANSFIDWLDAHGLSNEYVALFTHDSAARYMRYLEERDMANKTYNNYLTFMSTLFLYFVKKEYIRDNPFDRIDRKRVESKIRELIPSDVRHLIFDYFKVHSPTYIYIMLLCYRYLIRPKEALMIRVGYIDFDEGLVTLPPSVTKNHRKRTVALGDDVMSYFRSLQGLAPELYVFSNGYLPGTRLLTTRDTGKTWATMRNELDLPMNFQFYSLKDTGITEMLESGMPSKMVKDLADHSSLEMTERYLHKANAKRILECNTLQF